MVDVAGDDDAPFGNLLLRPFHINAFVSGDEAHLFSDDALSGGLHLRHDSSPPLRFSSSNQSLRCDSHVG
jgi:hypothetical protein